MLSAINTRISNMAIGRVGLRILLLLLLLLVDTKSHEAAVLSSQQASPNQPAAVNLSQLPPSPSSSTAGASGGLKPITSQEQSPSGAEIGPQMSNSISGFATISQSPQHQAPPPQPMSKPQPVGLQTALQPTILPKVNIFASSAEVKKLLGKF